MKISIFSSYLKRCKNSWALDNFYMKVICCNFFITCWKLRAKFVPRLQICISISIHNNNWVSVYKSIHSRAFCLFFFWLSLSGLNILVLLPCIFLCPLTLRLFCSVAVSKEKRQGGIIKILNKLTNHQSY